MEKENKLRLLYMAKVITERTDEDTTLTGPEIIEILKDEYDISTHRQTLASDINLLTDFGMDIEIIKSNPNRYHLVSREFDATELKLLIDAVASSKFISTKKSKELIEKISLLVGRNKAKELQTNIEVEGRIKTDNEKVYLIVDAINSAINNKKKIIFQYWRYNGTPKRQLTNNGDKYVFSPHRLVWDGERYYMIGWSDKHDGIATFRIDRIKSCPEILDNTAHKMPKDFNLNTFMNTTFRMYNSEAKAVTLECDADTYDSVVDKFGEKINAKFSDETYTVTVKVAVNHLLYGWIFGFGGKVRIVGPREVKKEYSEMVKNAYIKLEGTK